MKSIENKIKLFWHCATCMTGRLEVGWTEKGIQAWCPKCDKSVMALDFKGQKVGLL